MRYLSRISYIQYSLNATCISQYAQSYISKMFGVTPSCVPASSYWSGGRNCLTSHVSCGQNVRGSRLNQGSSIKLLRAFCFDGGCWVRWDRWLRWRGGLPAAQPAARVKKEECAAITIDDRSFSGFYRQRRDRCYVDVAIFVGFQYPVALKVLWRVLAVFQQTQLTSRCDKVQDYFA